MGLEYYNECQDYICVEGINGHTSVMYTDTGFEETLSNKVATMKDFAKHLKQMGRDSLKMDLENLLNITKHN